MSFLQDVNKWLVKVHQRYNRAFQNTARDVSMSIAEKSPVSSGKLLGRWEPAKNGPQTNNYEGAGPDAWFHGPSGWEKNEAIAQANRKQAMADLVPRIETTVQALEDGDTYYFSNDANRDGYPYVLNAEFHGWRKIGPYRMVGQTEQAFQQIVAEAVKQAKVIV